MSIKTHFSIKDLENLSGVKAHTIRIWEKRYGLLEPERTGTNIRKYSLENLKRLLNITQVYNGGVKISKIARYKTPEIKNAILKSTTLQKENYAINTLKIAMLNFDKDHFNIIFDNLKETKTFEEIFEKVFIPFLQKIGNLWQLGTINVAHERFASEIIKRKTILHIEQQVLTANKHSLKTTFCLFLPLNEIHDIGLLYANYQLEKAGLKTIYLGTNIPLESLKTQIAKDEDLIFVTYFTIKPDNNNIASYFNNYISIVCKNNPYPLWILGPKHKEITKNQAPKNIQSFKNLGAFLTKIEQTKISCN